MATFPSGIVTLTNPSSSTLMSVVSHAGEHVAANNEIVAIETALGVNLANVVPASYLSTSATLAENSDTKVATQKAVKTYADNMVLTGGGIPLGYLDTDGTAAANSDTKVPSQKAMVTYVGANNGVKSDGTVGFVNLLEGGDFERWSAGTSDVPPDGWVKYGSGTLSRGSGASAMLGVYSLGVTRAGANTGVTYVTTRKSTAGRTYMLTGWIKANVNNSAGIEIVCGASSQNIWHNGNGAWQKFAVPIVCATSAVFTVYCSVIANDTAYFDGLQLVEGASEFAFTPHPNDQHRYKIISGSRDIAAASNDVAYTGAGGTPKAVIAIGALAATKCIQMGFADQASASLNANIGLIGDTGTSSIDGKLMDFYATASAYSRAHVKSFDADGVTLTWEKVSTPTGTANFYLLFLF